MEETEDEQFLPEDVLANDEEIARALVETLGNSETNIRLMKAAQFILARSRQLKRTHQPEDLLQDAIEAVLSGRRKWPMNRVDFKGLLVGVMRSMVYSQDNTLLKKTPGVTMEHELHLVGEDQEPVSLEAFSVDYQTPEYISLRNEQDALDESWMAVLHARYGPKELHWQILDKVRESFSSHVEIRRALGIEESLYRNAWKGLMRAAESLIKSAKE